MAVIIRIDVDRPYGIHPFMRHVLSRGSSDLYFPRIPAFGFLRELRDMLHWLNQAQARAYVFFRRCTLPSRGILDLIEQGNHEMGLHLEDSRSFNTFLAEKQIVERHIAKELLALSKHGSGGAKYGFHHHAPYEPDHYIAWAQQTSMRLFLGNLEDPSLQPADRGVTVFPSAFWLERPWRDTEKFTVAWLLNEARNRDVVLLVHPENVLADSELSTQFKTIIQTA